MSSAMLFDNFVKSTNNENILLPHDVYCVYSRSCFHPEEEKILQWALYPKRKMPILVETNKVFGHLMVQKVRETDPLETIDLNVNVAQFNRAQMRHVKRERDIYKEKFEKAQELWIQLEERINSISQEEFPYENEQKIAISLRDTNQWKYKAEKFQKKAKKLEEQGKKNVYNMMADFLAHIHKEMMLHAN